jgi:hypothetical protein
MYKTIDLWPNTTYFAKLLKTIKGLRVLSILIRHHQTSYFKCGEEAL